MSINGRDIFDLMAYIGFKPILKDNGPATDFYWEEDDSVKISLDNIHHARDLVFKMLDAAKEDGYLMAKEEFEDDLNKAQKIIKFYEDAASKRIIPTVVKR